MDTLMAPWRYAYISGSSKTSDGKKHDCIFCDFPKEDDDKAHGIIHRGKTCFVILNAYPYSSGHVMVVPYRHTTDLLSFTSEEALEFHRLTALAVECLKSALHPEGFNIGINLGSAAGAGIATHVHRHIVPRWNGDVNFMGPVGNTRVVPMSLGDAWELLRKHWPGESDK